MNNQPILNIGCLGSVSDGKSTLIEKLTGIKTQKHSSEKIKNITIKQGYGNMKIWKNKNNLEYYSSDSINLNDNLISTFSNNSKIDDYELVHHISFVDCPGHQDLIHTMLSSISLMNGAIIVISVDQSLLKKPQLIQHLAAVKISNLKNIIICLNKIDLVTKKILYERKKELDELLNKYEIKPFTIIPTCFNKKIGLNYLLKAIMILFNPSLYISITSNDLPIFYISRSFDINKPGTIWKDVKGGVLGGTLIKGKLKIGDEIEIKPNFKSKIISIKTDNIELNEVISGGLVAILTDIDPYYCKNDALSGNILSLINILPDISNIILVDCNLTSIFGYIWEPKINDLIKLQITTKICDAKLIEINNNKLKFELIKPICILKDQNIIICKIIDKILRVVGHGINLLL
jgi:translation initiation factor 2 subunit 3